MDPVSINYYYHPHFADKKLSPREVMGLPRVTQLVSGGSGLGTPTVWIQSPCFDLPPHALPHTHSNTGDLFLQGSLWDIFVQL